MIHELFILAFIIVKHVKNMKQSKLLRLIFVNLL
jgi:hypothetical protein